MQTIQLKSGNIVIHNNKIYSKEKTLLHCFYYVCKFDGCRGRIRVGFNMEFIGNLFNHIVNCVEEPFKIESKMALQLAEQAALNNNLTINRIHFDLLQNISQEAVIFLPSRAAILQSL